ncbi:hypothetical protein [Pseudomonas sp. NPDC087614]
MTAKLVELKREGWRDAAKTLRKVADDLDAGVQLIDVLLDAGEG